MHWLLDKHAKIGGIDVSWLSVLTSIAVLLVGFVLASMLSGRIARVPVTSSTNAKRWRATAARIASYTIRIVTVSLALQLSGIEVAKILAAVAVMAVGVGIAMQKVAENFVSGMILLAERSIREGDIIEFDGMIARVQHMGIRATVAQTLDEEEIIVPNSLLTQSSVKNLTLTEELYRLRVKVGVSYASDLDLVRETLRRAGAVIEWRDQTRDPVVLVLDFAASAIEMEVSIWTHDVWHLRRGQSALRESVWKHLKEAGIVIPFPQLDVRLVEPREQA